MSDLEAVLANIESNLDAAYERLFALLRIRSISTDQAYAEECRACADWHVQDLRSIGFKAEARKTQGHPIVVAHDRDSFGRSVLFYGHYDVQHRSILSSFGIMIPLSRSSKSVLMDRAQFVRGAPPMTRDRS